MPPNALLQDSNEQDFAGSSADGAQNTLPKIDETTKLLPNSLAKSLSPKHYKDIDGVRFWWLLACILLAILIAMFDSTFMASSHPVITSYFEASNAASWLTTVFYLTSTVTQPLYGRISDVTGRRPVYTFAILCFGLATAWCGFAWNIESFIIARALCGVAAGGMNAMSMILMSDAIKLEFRGIYQSYLNIAYGLGNGLGAALGGVLCDKLGWRAAFFVQCPFIFVLMLVAFFATPKNFGPTLAKSEGKSILRALENFDFAGVGVLVITVSGLILGINLGGNVFSWTHPLVLTALVVFVLSIPVLVYVERRAFRPMLPINLLAGTSTARLNWANVMSALLSAAVLFNVPLFLQAVDQVSPTTSGLVLISPLVMMSILSVFIGFYMAWTKKIKLPLIAGAISYFVGTAALSGLFRGIPTWAVLVIIPWCHAGQGFLGPASTVATLSLNPPIEQAIVVTTLGVARNIGSILGVAVSSWILQNALKVFLEQKVTGPKDIREHIIYEVRKSVKAIAGLDQKHKSQVVDAYMLSLRVMFASLCVFAIVLVVLILITPVPDLKADDATSNEDQGYGAIDENS